MLKTRFHNKTSEEVELKEGNGGVYSFLQNLKSNDHYDVVFDPNATYREYWVGSNSKGSITISSDDCVENENITIKDGPTPVFGARSKKQNPQNGRAWWQRLFG